MDYFNSTLAIPDPALDWLFPDQKRVIPNHPINESFWVLGGSPFFSTQWTQCSYQISGGYGHFPRYIYYAFILVAVFGRKTPWLANATLGLVMTYSSAAAIHAFILAIIRKQLAPDILFQNDNWEIVQAIGSRWSGHVNETSDSYAPYPGDGWLPVLPMAWDNDGDAVLAIVGTAFLTLLPMQIWSSTVRHASKEKKILIGLWSILLLIGTVSALIYVEYVLVWSLQQLRFCPTDKADPLPFQNQGPYPYPGAWIPGDWYRWNRIIGDIFVHHNSSLVFPDTCLYPCFAFEWPLRDPSEIYTVPADYGSMLDTNTGYWLLLWVYYIVTSSCLCNIWFFVAWNTRWTNKTKSRFGMDRNFVSLINERKFADLSRKFRERILAISKPSSLRTLLRDVFVGLCLLYVPLFSICLSPIALIFFIIYCEVLIFVADPGGESPRHVGQWGALVGAFGVLTAGAAPYLFEHYGPKKQEAKIRDVALQTDLVTPDPTTTDPEQGPRSWWRH